MVREGSTDQWILYGEWNKALYVLYVVDDYLPPDFRTEMHQVKIAALT